MVALGKRGEAIKMLKAWLADYPGHERAKAALKSLQ
jgi:hypothetical protein